MDESDILFHQVGCFRITEQAEIIIL